MSSKDFLLQVAKDMGKKPEDFQKYLDILEENMIDTVESLGQLTEEELRKDLNFPLGLVKAIIKSLAAQSQPKIVIQPQKTEQINTLSKNVSQKEERKELTVEERCFQHLCDLTNQCDKGQLRVAVETLYKVLSNIRLNPMDPKFRTLKKANKGIQEKILSFPEAVKFLLVCGFEETGEEFNLTSFDMGKLEQSVASIEKFIQGLGANIQASGPTFDPYKASISSTTGESYRESVIDQPKTKLQLQREEIEAIERTRIRNLEGTLQDREIEVYNDEAMKQKKQQLIAEQQRREDQEMKFKREQKLLGNGQDDVAMEDEADDRLAAIRLIQENKKASVFRDATQMKLEQARGRAQFTRSRVRVKFPDGFMIEANFGGRETFEAVYNFVRENLNDKSRAFYLFETPPKRKLAVEKKSLDKAKMCPSCLLYFSWEDEQATFGSYLNLQLLKQFITLY